MEKEKNKKSEHRKEDSTKDCDEDDDLKRGPPPEESSFEGNQHSKPLPTTARQDWLCYQGIELVPCRERCYMWSDYGKMFGMRPKYNWQSKCGGPKTCLYFPIGRKGIPFEVLERRFGIYKRECRKCHVRFMTLASAEHLCDVCRQESREDADPNPPYRE